VTLHKNKISYKKVSISRSPYSHTKLEEKKTILKKELGINSNGDIPNHDNVIGNIKCSIAYKLITKR